MRLIVGLALAATLLPAAEPPAGSFRDDGEYQNGGYWATPLPWLMVTLMRTEPERAAALFCDAVEDFQARHDINEWVNDEAPKKRGARDYCASAALPLEGARRLRAFLTENGKKLPPPLAKRFDAAEAWLRPQAMRILRASSRLGKDGVRIFTADASGGYAAFWVRDWSYAIEGCPEAFTHEEIRQGYLFLAAAQREDGCMPDRVDADGKAVYSPGSEARPFSQNGSVDQSPFMVILCHQYWKLSHDIDPFRRTAGALEKAMRFTPRNPVNGLVTISDAALFRPYSFLDTVPLIGDQQFDSVLYWEACRKLAEMFDAAAQPARAAPWVREARRVQESLASLWDDRAGMFVAASEKWRQPSVFGSLFAVYSGIATPQQSERIAAECVKNEALIVKHGQIRHLPRGMFWGAAAAPPAVARQTIVYASRTGAKLDSDVRTGGGHDDTAALQAILDQATTDPLELVMDGAALVSGLTIHSHTTIRCLSASCGFFLKKQSNRPLLINAHRTADPEAIVDEDVRLLGGTYNGNGLPDENGAIDGNQRKSTREYSFTVALGFYGIADFTATGITILQPRNYALHLANWRHVVLENDRVDVGVSEGMNYDGIHFNGPGHDASVRNVSVHSWDDALAFNADDQAVVNSPDGPSMKNPISYGVPWLGNGPISDVVVDGLFLDHSLFGLRILSTASRVDRITVRNIHGDCRGWAVTIDNFFDNFHSGPGNMGGITVENIDVNPHDWPSAYASSKDRIAKYVNIGCSIESLTLKNIRQSHRTDDRPIVNLATQARVQSLQIDGVVIQDAGMIEEGQPRVALVGDAAVAQFSLSGVAWLRPTDLPRSGVLLETRGSGGIGVLSMRGISAARSAYLVKQTGGTLGQIAAANIIDADSAENGGTFWLQRGTATLTLSNWVGPAGRQVVGPGSATVVRRGDAFSP